MVIFAVMWIGFHGDFEGTQAIFWVNYNDLSTTKPWTWWLTRETIPKWLHMALIHGSKSFQFTQNLDEFGKKTWELFSISSFFKSNLYYDMI